MNQPQSNFEQLHKLLALKKREVPPPGYFNNFSSQVVSRIRLGETARNSDGLLGSLFAEAPWLLRLVQVFEAKPAYAGAFASGLCLLLVAAIVYTDHSDVPADTLMPTQTAQASPAGAALGAVPVSFLSQSAAASDLGSSTNPLLNFQPASTSFASPNSMVQPAIFTH